ncbi:MAG: hypothetical protein K2W96_23445 [Gemmataceae bacterium]|nr:hypothetical protein [Gemmataceae bacterium]
MKQEEFERVLGQFKHRKPFAPFVIELRDGRAIKVDEPAVAFDENGGAFLSADDDIITFRRDEVANIRLDVQEVAP